MSNSVAVLWNNTAFDIETFSGTVDILNKLPNGREKTWSLIHGAAFVAYKAYGGDYDDDVEGYLELVDKLNAIPTRQELLNAELELLCAINWNVPSRSTAQRASQYLLDDRGELRVPMDAFEYAVAFVSSLAVPAWANDALKALAAASLSLYRAKQTGALCYIPDSADRTLLVRYLNVLFNAQNLA